MSKAFETLRELHSKIDGLESAVKKIKKEPKTDICIAFRDRPDSMYIDDRYGLEVDSDFQNVIHRVLLAHYEMKLHNAKQRFNELILECKR